MTLDGIYRANSLGVGQDALKQDIGAIDGGTVKLARRMENMVGHQNSHDFALIRISLPSVPCHTVIRSVEEAAEKLLTRWPADDGEWFYEAVKACLDCLHGNIEPKTARHAVICAAREAGFEIEDVTWGFH